MIRSAQRSSQQNVVEGSILLVSYMLSVMSGTQLEDLISLVVIVQFEEFILAILPTVCFLFLTPFRAIRLARRKIKVRRNALYIAKLVSRLRRGPKLDGG